MYVLGISSKSIRTAQNIQLSVKQYYDGRESLEKRQIFANLSYHQAPPPIIDIPPRAAYNLILPYYNAEHAAHGAVGPTHHGVSPPKYGQVECLWGGVAADVNKTVRVVGCKGVEPP